MPDFKKKQSFRYKDERPDLGNHYKNEPGEDFDYNRWANGQENCWRVSTRLVEQVKYKAHIINNPLFLLNKIGFGFNQDVDQYLKHYKKSKIFIPDATSKLVPLQTSICLSASIREIIPESPENLLQLGAQQELSKDQIKIIDYTTTHIPKIDDFKQDVFELEELHSFNVDDFAQMEVSCFKRLLGSLSKPLRVGMIVTGKHYRWRPIYVEKILQTCQVEALHLCGYETKKDITNVLSDKKNQEHLRNLKKLQLTYLSSHLLEFLSVCPQLKSVELEMHCLKVLKNVNIKTLACSNVLEELALKSCTDLPFLYSLPRLKKFRLIDRQCSIDWHRLSETSPHLEEIDIEHPAIDDLQMILTVFPNLKRLRIQGGPLNDNDEKNSLGSLKPLNLEKLELCYGNWHPGILPTLLQYCPRLQKLYMSDVDECFDEKQWESADISLSQLIDLKLDIQYRAKKFETAAVVKLLEKSPNLEDCHINGMGNPLSTAIRDKKIQLSKLKNLQIENTNIDDNAVRNLIHDAKDLAKIRLSEILKNSENLSNTFSNDFPNLQHIEMNHGHSLADALVKQAPSAKKIIIKGRSNQKNKFSLASLPAEELTHLELHDFFIDSEELAKLIASTPHLKTLKLIQCKLTGNANVWKSLSLQLDRLKKIDVSGSIIPSNFILTLLAHSPHLKTLDCPDANIKGMPEEAIALHGPELENVNFYEAEFHAATFEKILNAASKITRFEYKENFDEVETKAFSHLTQLEHLSFANSNKSEHLNTLLKSNPSLQSLHLSFDNKTTLSVAKEVVLPALEEIYWQYEVDETLLSDLLAKSEKLRCLSFEFSKGPFSILDKHKKVLNQLQELTIAGMPRYLLQHCHKIKHLVLDGLSGDYDKHLSVNLPCLTQLNFKNIRSLTDLELILQSGVNIRQLELNFNKKINLAEAGKILLAYLPNLKLTKLMIHNMDTESAAALKKIFPHAHIRIGLSNAVQENFTYDVDEYRYEKEKRAKQEISDPQNELADQYEAEEKKPKSVPLWANRAKRILDNQVRHDPETHYHLKQYILPNKKGFPDPSQYILDTYDALVMEDGMLVLKEEKSITPIPVSIPQKKQLKQFHQNEAKDAEYDATHFFARVPVHPMPGKLISLPGISTADEIEFFETNSDVPIEFFIDKNTNRYYAKVDDKKSLNPLSISYVIKTKTPNPISNPFPPMDIKTALKIVDQIHFDKKGQLRESVVLKQFDKYAILQALLTVMTHEKIWGPKNIDLNFKGYELLNAFLKNKSGRCEQQAILAKALADALNIPCMVDTNDCHAIPRFLYKSNWLSEEWFRVNVGGYPFKSTIEKLSDEKPGVVRTKEEKFETPFDEKISAPGKKTFKQFYAELNAQLDSYSPTKRNALLYCANELSLLSMAGEIMESSKASGQDSFFIDDLDEIGAHAFSSKTGKTSSALKQFLERQKKLSPANGVLVINCSKQSPGIFNAYQALDHLRKLGDVGEIPPGIKIVCLIDKNNIRQDASFSSRFSIKPKNNKDIVDDHVTLDADFVLKRCLTKVPDNEKFVSAPLHGGDFANSELFGKPCLTNKGFEFKQGPMNIGLLPDNESIEDKKNDLDVKGIEIINPSQGNLSELYKTNRELYVNLLKQLAQGKTFVDACVRQVKPDFKIALTQRAYQFANACAYEPLTKENVDQATHILNFETYSHFLKQFSCEEKTGKLCEKMEGILFQHANKSLVVRVTQSLAHAGLWERFFACAKENNVSLKLILHPGVRIPTVTLSSCDEKKATPVFVAEIQKLADENIFALPACSVVLSNDPDASADKIAGDLNARLIHVGKTHRFADLFESFQKQPDSADGSPCLHHATGELIDKLIRGETIVLTGEFSPELAARLETLAAPKGYLRINGVDTEIKGRLIVVTSSNQLLPGCLNRYTHQPTLTNTLAPRSDTVVRRDNEVKSSATSAAVFKSLELKASDEQAERLHLLSEKLQQDESCIFVEGPTAAGKSTSIRKFLPDYFEKHYDQKVKIFEGGLERLKACLEYQKQNPKTLCIYFADEANLKANGTYDFLQGYYQKHQPGIMLDREFYVKNPNLKIVFAGNPPDYSERQKHDFFLKHPEMFLQFKNFTTPYIKHYVLKPLLKKLLADIKLPNNKFFDFDYIIKMFFSAEHLVKSPNVLTIRNWDQMCFRLAMFLSKRGAHFSSVTEAVALAAYEELEHLINPAEKIHLQELLFDSTEKYTQLTRKLNVSVAKELKVQLKEFAVPFKLTQSRYGVARLLDDQLKIRDFRLQYPEYSGEGLRCTMLEGPIAVGKTIMAQAILEANGFVNASKATPKTDLAKIYYFITPTNREDDHKAFHGGHPTLCDEYNVLMREGRFNAYATGVDSEGQSADREGWMMWATQNPAWGFDQRKGQSRASKNRFLTIPIEAYPPEEQYELLIAKGVAPVDAQNLIRSGQHDSLRELEAEADKRLQSEGRNLARFSFQTTSHQEFAHSVSLPTEPKPSMLQRISSFFTH